MVNVHTATTALFGFIRDTGVAIAQLLSQFEFLLRNQLLALGFPRSAQTLILIAIAALLVLGVARLSVGLLRIGAATILSMVVIHLVVALVQG